MGIQEKNLGLEKKGLIFDRKLGTARDGSTFTAYGFLSFSFVRAVYPVQVL
jgi:hypothetical protein